MANGVQFTQNVATAGVVALPATQPDACVNGRVFVGWTAEKDYENASVAPTYIKGGEVIEAAATYYAVYATAEESGEAAFDGNNGGKFKFYSQVGDKKYYATATINTSYKLESSTNEAEAAEFTFEKVDGGFTIKVNDQYLAYNGSKTNIGLKDNAYTWAISASESGCGAWRVIASTADTRALALSATETYQSFGAYATSNINCTQYFDLEIGGGSGASYKDYSTSCGSAEPCALTGITLNTDKVAKEFKTGDVFSYEGLVVTAQYSNCSNRTVTPESVSTPDMSKAGEKTVTVSYTENEVTKTAEYKITVSDPATYTIRFFSNGDQIGADQVVVEGKLPEVPADPEACGDYSFGGWYTAALAKDNTDKPVYVTDFKAVKDQDYYATFTRTEAGEGGEKAFDGETEGKYKIYGLAGETKYYATAHVNTSFKIDATTDEAEAAEFTLEKVEGGFTIKTGEKYLAYSGSGTNVDLEPDAFTWSIGASEAGRGTWRAIAGTYTTRAFALRVNANFQSFGGYATSNIKANSEYYDLEIVGGASSTTYYTAVLDCSTTGVKNVQNDNVQGTKVLKVLRDGQLYILYDGTKYDVLGRPIKN